MLAQDDELVRRYQQFVRPYAGRIYVALAFVLALIGASGTIGQWNNWILFLHGGNFGVTDPQFHKDIGFYVFKLPFLTFVVDWTLAILIVTLAVVVVFHYLNGGIQPQRGLPRVRPPVKAHVSVLLALIALDKAVGYVLQRWSLVNAQDGYVNGAGYTDVHARLPAETLLIWVSVFAAGILLFNIRRQGWTLPVLAIGIWAFVALVVGIIYPALLQALKVTPAQSSLEAPYIKRNITATRDAYGLEPRRRALVPGQHVDHGEPAHSAAATDHRQHPPVGPGPDHFAAGLPARAGDLQVVLHVPLARGGPLHDRRAAHAGPDRRARDLGGNLPSHVVGQHAPAVHARHRRGHRAESNQTSSSNPVYGVGADPAAVVAGAAPDQAGRRLLRPGRDGLRRGQHQAARGGLPDLGQHERGEPLHGHGRRAAVVALQAGGLRAAPGRPQPADLEPDHGPVPDHVRARPGGHGAEGGAVPHLQPEPLRRGRTSGHIDWVVDGYTTTSNYPYSQNADSQQVAVGSSLPSSYNYVRNSVKVVIDAYSGKMTFYDADPKDPILQAYEAAFPHMFTPLSKMPAVAAGAPALPPGHLLHSVGHLRALPPDEPGRFYAASNAWQLSPTAGAGPKSQALLAENTYNSQGQLVSTDPGPHGAPVPGVRAAQHEPAGVHGVRRLRAGVAGEPDQQQPELQPDGVDGGAVRPGALRGSRRVRDAAGTLGPANADAEISANSTVSTDISLLDQNGSEVLLGETLMVPIGNSMVYLRPMYVSPSTNPQPQLKYVVAVLGKDVQVDTSLPTS